MGTVLENSKLGSVRGAEAIDRDNEVITGFVVAELGDFADGRGRFDLAALKRIVQLGNTGGRGLKVHMGHPAPFGDDQIPNYLGRARTFRMSHASGRNGDVPAVRADLYLDPAAHNSPKGDLAGYIMDRAESDPDSFASSLVLNADTLQEQDSRGRPVLGEDGQPLPPLWMPTALHAVDVVDTGAAVTSFLSSAPASLVPFFEGMTLAASGEAVALLERAFHGKSRRFVEKHMTRFIDRYLELRFGPEPATKPAPKPIVEEIHFDGGVSVPARMGFRRQLAAVPESFRKAFFRHGGTIRVTANDVTEAGLPADCSEAMGTAQGTRVVVAEKLAFFSSRSILHHEVGHAIDFICGDLSAKPEWKSIWWAIRSNLNNDRGVREDPSEAFAESFAVRLSSRGSLFRPATALADPRIADYFVALEQKLASR